MNPSIEEETKEHLNEENSILNKVPLLLNANEGSKVLFTTKANDSEYAHIKGNPISIVATNICSYMGGRADPWR